MRRQALLALLVLLSGCKRDEAPPQVERISLDEVRQKSAEPMASPLTEGSSWQVSSDGQAIGFGPRGGKPFLTLACRADSDPPVLRVVRHVTARPGEKALFPVLGGGRISRIPLDARLSDGEWRWQGDLLASDERVDAFTGGGRIEATLPGGGTLLMDGSRIPGEFVNWCRNGGATARAEGAENAQQREEKASSPQPTQ